MIEYTTKLNEGATLREYLIKYVVDLPIINKESIQMQSDTLLVLTKSVNELTRSTLVLRSLFSSIDI